MVARAMTERGLKVSVYSLAGSGALRGEFDRGAVNVILPPFDREKGSRFMLNRIARMAAVAVHLLTVIVKRKPRIVHFFLPAAYLVGAPLALLAQVPICVMSRRSLNAYQARYLASRSVERFFHRRMTAIVANSRCVFRELREEEGAPSDRLALVYNGIDVRTYASAPGHVTRAELDLAPTAFVMVIVANLIPYKGHDDLLQALSIVRAELPQDWRLLIAGRDDGIGVHLREQARKLSIEENVRILGVRKDIPSLLAASDVGILCSHEEGFSNAILEGMAAGLPMIVTDVGGNPEAITDNENGLLVPSKDPSALGRAILRLVKDSDLRKRLGVAARQRVAERFTLDRCITDYDTLYRALLDNGRVPATLQVSN